MKSPDRIKTTYFPAAFLAAALLVHAGLVAHIAATTSPNVDEAGHLAAGVYSWQYGRFDLYQVNPPLVRAVAAAPAFLLGVQTDWSGIEGLHHRIGSRPEWSIGLAFLEANSDDIRWHFAFARWACIPFSLLGGFYCWRLARELHGPWAGAFALILWCFCPNIITWSSTICPDGPAAALGIVAGYYFWRWLRHDDWSEVFVAGITLGLALLTKLTWIILLFVWPVLTIAWLCDRERASIKRWKQRSVRLAAVLFVGLVILNLGYLFEGTFTSLGDFTFVSRALAADKSILDDGPGGNRFADIWLGSIPVPLPRSYVQGIDLQKTDFERGMSSYLLGEWRDRGWWYYYIVCAVLKVPLGTWLLGLLAIGMALRDQRSAAATQVGLIDKSRATPNHIGRLDEFVLLLPAIVLFVLVSSQTGFSRHFRYVLPAFPFLFVWISRVASGVPWKSSRLFRAIVVGLLGWGVFSSLRIYPYSMSYFNELIGGPGNGHRYLLDSNIDWGQDIYELEEWFDGHPETRPRYILFCDATGSRVFRGEYDKELTAQTENASDSAAVAEERRAEDGLVPGWYALSVHGMYGPEHRYGEFRRMKPVATIGYSFRVYKFNGPKTNNSPSDLPTCDSPGLSDSGGGRTMIPEGGRKDERVKRQMSARRMHFSEAVRRDAFRLAI